MQDPIDPEMLSYREIVDFSGHELFALGVEWGAFCARFEHGFAFMMKIRKCNEFRAKGLLVREGRQFMMTGTSAVLMYGGGTVELVTISVGAER